MHKNIIRVNIIQYYENWGGLIQRKQKSYRYLTGNFYMKIFLFYMKNVLVRKNKECACLKRF